MITEDNYVILIPARKGSKGLPLKNRCLFDFTASTIPAEKAPVTYVSTDDDFIKDKAKLFDFKIHNRSEASAKDTATSKEMLLDFANKNFSKRYIITLYLTYPERKWKDIKKAIIFFNENKSKSTLCKKSQKVSPYLMMYEEPNNKGSQVISHNLCRRQDYRKCFEISHFISIVDREEIYSLNNNLYNKDTDFMQIDDVFDIDTPKDMESFKNE